MKRMNRFFLTLILSTFLSFSAKAREYDIVDTAVRAGSFKTLVSLVQTAGLVDTLKSPGPFTVFAPTDAAFAKLPKKLVDQLLSNPDLLKKVLTYHVVSGEVSARTAVHFASRAVRGTPIGTVAGQNVVLNLRGAHPQLFINDSRVIGADIQTTNGVIHAIDTVLLPELN